MAGLQLEQRLINNKNTSRTTSTTMRVPIPTDLAALNGPVSLR
jgi:hypothetical protein